ncbi:hypothetical protein PSCICM_06880 [Pseudomonas cichorii]|nr:hypothetical protein PSCICM_06880 [Pseudomonas cichorii]
MFFEPGSGRVPERPVRDSCAKDITDGTVGTRLSATDIWLTTDVYRLAYAVAGKPPPAVSVLNLFKSVGYGVAVDFIVL